MSVKRKILVVGGCEQLQQHEQLLLQPHAHGGHGQLQHEPQLHGGQGDDEGILVAADGEEQQANGLGQPFQLLLMVVVVVVVVDACLHAFCFSGFLGRKAWVVT